MIRLENVTKKIQKRQILDGISFELQSGQIAGFLGPNGAGKTTTFRIITQYLMPDQGQILIGGLDTLHHPQTTRQMVGYLPENPCLYPEMTVRDYLMFIARIKHLSIEQRKKQYPAIIEQTNLSTSQHQVINRLSKGYRKRVALAQALLGNPKILILDEPFSGLDSFQMSDTRRLIRELAYDRIILLSSHILAEVDQLCSHLIIIDKGRIITNGSSETVIQHFLKTLKFRLTLSPLTSTLIECLQRHPQIIRIDRIGESAGNQIEIETVNRETIQQEIAQIIQTHHAMVIEFIPISNRLEDMYLKVIK